MAEQALTKRVKGFSVTKHTNDDVVQRVDGWVRWMHGNVELFDGLDFKLNEEEEDEHKATVQRRVKCGKAGMHLESLAWSPAAVGEHIALHAFAWTIQSRERGWCRLMQS
ncbi:hypothetical protein V6N12_031587 [Hibiscus sabdariffa]|uniref:Uncharacterized protein n=1 Tax=Hibiscus sabdariffa TaxID=183260 RepID=A0ABR2DV29_9ROSI